jgi:hypothetical protein
VGFTTITDLLRNSVSPTDLVAGPIGPVVSGHSPIAALWSPEGTRCLSRRPVYPRKTWSRNLCPAVCDSRSPENPGGWSFRGGRVSQVTGPSSLSVPLATHPAGLPSTRLRASGSAAFQAKNPLSTGNLCHFGADTGGPLTRLATLQPPPNEDDCKPGYQPAGYALAGWGSHPQDDSSEFQSIS